MTADSHQNSISYSYILYDVVCMALLYMLRSSDCDYLVGHATNSHALAPALLALLRGVEYIPSDGQVRYLFIGLRYICSRVHVRECRKSFTPALLAFNGQVSTGVTSR